MEYTGTTIGAGITVAGLIALGWWDISSAQKGVHEPPPQQEAVSEKRFKNLVFDKQTRLADQYDGAITRCTTGRVDIEFYCDKAHQLWAEGQEFEYRYRDYLLKHIFLQQGGEMNDGTPERVVRAGLSR